MLLGLPGSINWCFLCLAPRGTYCFCESSNLIRHVGYLLFVCPFDDSLTN